MKLYSMAGNYGDFILGDVQCVRNVAVNLDYGT
jgi:hypothetical protein